MARIQMTVDGERREDDVQPRLLLVHYLREQAGVSGRRRVRHEQLRCLHRRLDGRR